MKKFMTIWAVVVLYLANTSALATINFNDGLIHNIDYDLGERDVKVDYQTPNMYTTLNILPGGDLSSLWGVDLYEQGRINICGGRARSILSYGSSQVNLSSGSIYFSSVCYNSSQVNISGGSVYEYASHDSSQIEVSGGLITSILDSQNSSQINITGGSIKGWLSSRHFSKINIVSGSIDAEIDTYDSSQIEISGGLLSGDWFLSNESKIKIFGSNFAMDGSPVGFCEITSILGGAYGSEPVRHLTGTLLSGDLIDNDFRIGNTAKIILAPGPTTPVADAGSNQTAIDTDDNSSEVVTLDGSGSSDSDGTIVSWVWTDNLGDTIPDGEITIATLSIGTHTITLTVTDDDGLTDSNTVTITVEPCPNPPNANADGPYTIYVDDTLTLDANSSTDDDNDIVSYMWDLDDNNSFETDAGSQAIFDVNYAYLLSLGLLVDNTYNIRLKVTDSKNQSDIADSTLTIIPKPALQVAVDIKPGGCPNPLNVKSSGVLPVAILGTEDVNVSEIDATSIQLAGVSVVRHSYEDVATPMLDSNDCNCTTEGPDGYPDLTLKFKTQQIVEAIGEVNNGDILVLELTGVLLGERPIEGADCIVIRGRFKPLNKADFNGDGKVDMADFAAFAENWLETSIVD